MKRFDNPLRYPGSKAKFVKEVKQFLIQNTLSGFQIVEPYAGGASVSLGLLADGAVSSAILIERDPLVYSFWYSVFYRTEELLRAIETVSVDMDTWVAFGKYRDFDEPSEACMVEMGLAGLFFNRTNFSGVIHAGPIGGMSQSSAYDVACRFNKLEVAKKIKQVASLADRVEVYFGDALDALRDASEVDNSTRFFYVDPPYYSQGKKLYRYHYSFADHKKLAEVLSSAKYRWLLSYDHHPVIEHLYSDFYLATKLFKYSSKSPKNENELLITNVAPDKPVVMDATADIETGRRGGLAEAQVIA
jgi:DNA adenine methylase